MTDFEMLRFVATDPVPTILRYLARNPKSTFSDASATYGPNDSSLETEFSRRNLVTPPSGQLSVRGRTCFCCIEGIEGANTVELVDKLRNADPSASRVSLVRQGMTTRFIDLLARLEPLKRLMICSPWINLDRQRLRKLIIAIEKARQLSGFHPEVTVVTRPMDDQPDGENNETLGYFQRIGAVLCWESRLHSKLYIIESGAAVAKRYAFVGSENFTKVRYQELGIFVDNDNLIIDDLIRYFLNIVTTRM